MTPLAEIAPSTLNLGNLEAACGIISFLGTAGGFALVLWLRTKFVGKTAYYHDKAELEARVAVFDKRLAEAELALALFKAAGIQKTLEDLKVMVTTLQKTLDDSLHALDKRVSLIEQKGKRGGGGGR